ncbi:mannose-1-phosphate guanylyltransferase [Nonlabens spongiae]|uniref:mannose-1-phosphate guanylyltransferase n=1 Tax=Nonlabens spongiae TaxID=331648 RepID=A0A1W6MHZ8_9FLAO|nr:mannose-1-phosphate guanylyltransferase [Nonlabens spongiae]ARN77221.1 mannose-1-phosphate guanylyltransferase [Nonlabens spongiae]
MKENRYAVIMAGGVGSRFWPVSKKSFPKQFHDMLGIGSSLLQMTYNRLEKIIPSQNILILTNEDYTDLVKEQLPEILAENIVAEPAMRNTAPCILLAALKIQKRDKNAVMIVAPSDHYIQKEEQFQKNVLDAFDFCTKNQNALMTLGITPTSPNTGYGYIEYVKDEQTVHKVSQFREKPDLETAMQFLAAGNFLWNAGIFVWSVDGVVSAFAKAQPKLHMLFSNGQPVYNSNQEQEWLEENYEKAENISVDYAIMEQSDAVYVIAAEFPWSDLGTWGSLHSELSTEKESVALNNELVEMDSSGNMVRTKTIDKVFLLGMEDVIVVEDGDLLMIASQDKEQNIKQLRDRAMEKFGKNLG